MEINLIPTRVIRLTRGKVTTVDASDYESLMKFKWYARRDGGKWYAARGQRMNGKSTTVYMHRTLMRPTAGMQVDHRDGDGLNNTRLNIRLATSSQNHCNQRLSRRNTSGYKGIWWHKRDRLWAATIRVARKRIHLGYFKEKDNAYKAYCEASKKYHGEYGRVS